MKKYILLLCCLALTTQSNLKISAVFAQGEDGRLAVQDVIKNYLATIGEKDLDSALKYISLNFSAAVNGKTINYDENKVRLKKRIDHMLATYVDFKRFNFKMIKLDLNGDKAIAEVEYDWKGFDINKVKDRFGHSKRTLSLAKENGSWKITSVMDASTEELSK